MDIKEVLKLPVGSVVRGNNQDENFTVAREHASKRLIEKEFEIYCNEYRNEDFWVLVLESIILMIMVIIGIIKDLIGNCINLKL